MNKFLANGKKQYMYTTIDGKFEFRGSGINGNNDESAYNGNINTGQKIIGHINPNITETEIDGKKYRSNGSYFETLHGNNELYSQLTQWVDYIIKERKQ